MVCEDHNDNDLRLSITFRKLATIAACMSPKLQFLQLQRAKRQQLTCQCYVQAANEKLEKALMAGHRSTAPATAAAPSSSVQGRCILLRPHPTMSPSSKISCNGTKAELETPVKPGQHANVTRVFHALQCPCAMAARLTRMSE